MSIATKNKYFAAMIAFGLAIPSGLANYFLPSFRASSEYDVETVYIPIVAVQVFLSVLYIFYINKSIFSSATSKIWMRLLFFCVAGPGLLSLSIPGYYSYSLTWLVVPILVAQYYSNGDFDQWEGLSIFSRIGMIFLPFYCLDFILSITFNKLDRFSSYMFATNGHSFLSFLFVLFLLFFKTDEKTTVRLRFYRVLCIAIYFAGGIYSASRVPFFSMLFALLLFYGRRYLYILFFIGFFLYFSVSLNDVTHLLDQVDIESNLVSNLSELILLNADNTVAWSSAYSRLAIWNTFWDTFFANPISGAGGLAVNLFKYEYGYPFDVFIDPHNEFLYLLSGFGLSGVLFVGVSLSYIASHFKSIKFAVESSEAKVRYIGILGYMFICSFANANSAKQNIEFLFVVVLCVSLGNLVSMKRVQNRP